jgi:hypothetical protein
MLPTKFRYIWPIDLREEFLKSVNIHGHHMRFLFLICRFLKISETAWPNDTKHLWNGNTEPSGASQQMSVYFGKAVSEKIFLGN